MKRSINGTPVLQPNFFISIPVLNTEVVSKVGEVQKQLANLELPKPWHGVSNTSSSQDALIPPEKLQVTLNTMLLRNDEEVLKAKSILNEIGKDLKREFFHESMELTFEGVRLSGRDNVSVVLAQVKDTEEILSNLHFHFKKRFIEKLRIPIYSNPFHPHLTIAQISGSKKLNEERLSSFPPGITSGFENFHFGEWSASTRFNCYRWGLRIQLLDATFLMGATPSSP